MQSEAGKDVICNCIGILQYDFSQFNEKFRWAKLNVGINWTMHIITQIISVALKCIQKAFSIIRSKSRYKASLHIGSI